MRGDTHSYRNNPCRLQAQVLPRSNSQGLTSLSFLASVFRMHLSELKTQHVTELVDMAITNEIEGANRLRKQELIFALLKNRAKKGESIFGDGTLEVLPDGFGFLRSPDTSRSEEHTS